MISVCVRPPFVCSSVSLDCTQLSTITTIMDGLLIAPTFRHLFECGARSGASDGDADSDDCVDVDDGVPDVYCFLCSI